MGKQGRSTSSVLILLLISLLLSGCGSQSPQPVAQATVASQDPIVIGAVFNGEGWMTAYDQPPRSGALLAVEEINKAGGVLGRPLKIVELEGKSDAATVGNAALQLISQGVDFLITPSDFDVGGPASQAAQGSGLIGISPGATSPLYGSKTLGDLQFTLGMWNNTMSAAAAEFAYKNMGWRKAYVVTDTSIDYSLSLGRYFTKHFSSVGGTIVGEDTYMQGDQDFSAQLQRLKALAEKPDVIFISSYMPDLAVIVQQTRQAGITTPIMGGDCYDTVDFWSALGPDANDIYFSTHGWLGPEAGPAVVHFLDLYQAKYSKAPDSAFALLGWDAVYILAQAITKAGTTDSAAVAQAMESTNYDLLTGKLHWTSAADGHFPNKAAAIVKLDEGKTSFAGWILPESVPEP